MRVNKNGDPCPDNQCWAYRAKARTRAIARALRDPRRGPGLPGTRDEDGISCGFESLEEMLGWLGPQNVSISRSGGKIVYLTKALNGGDNQFFRSDKWIAYVWRHEPLIDEIFIAQHGLCDKPKQKI